MAEKDLILDHEESEVDPALYMANAGKRLTNFIIDRIGVYMYLFVLIILFEDSINDNVATPSDTLTGLLMLIGIPAYWLLPEYLWGKSLAKFITGTKVVSTLGARPTFLSLLGRTAARFIPFEPFSFLGSKPTGWHDYLSGTLVVLDEYPGSDPYV